MLGDQISIDLIGQPCTFKNLDYLVKMPLLLSCEHATRGSGSNVWFLLWVATRQASIAAEYL